MTSSVSNHLRSLLCISVLPRHIPKYLWFLINKIMKINNQSRSVQRMFSTLFLKTFFSSSYQQHVSSFLDAEPKAVIKGCISVTLYSKWSSKNIFLYMCILNKVQSVTVKAICRDQWEPILYCNLIGVGGGPPSPLQSFFFSLFPLLSLFFFWPPFITSST